MMIRKAIWSDLDAVEQLYNEIHDAEETGIITTGWLRGVYPSRESARAALERDDLFVLEEDGKTLGSGIINQIQVDVYEGAPWEFNVPDQQVCVLQTLVISPAEFGKGYARSFLAFYEECAREHRCSELRIDTNARNAAARAMYKKHGYKEIGIVPTVFNGIPGVNLVLLEKHLFGNRELYLRQKQLLDTFLEHGAISQAQYDKSLGDLTEKMRMKDVDS